MWPFFSAKKRAKAKLEKAYGRLLEEAMRLQRQGKIPEYAAKTAEANALLERIEMLERSEVTEGSQQAAP